jgi:hypothetical protein
LETIEELHEFLLERVRPDVWNQLLARGAAWSLMREEGILPEGAPPFGATIETDLVEYGFSMLRASLNLREKEGSSELVLRGFERAANAFEALVRNASAESGERGFHRTIAAASYHLASYSAIAYSLFADQGDDLNMAPGEDALAILILRDFRRLREVARAWLTQDAHSDARIAADLENGELSADDAIGLLLNGAIFRGLAYFDFALQTGEVEFLETARRILRAGLKLAQDAANVPLWWTIRLCANLIDDLWDHSLHEMLPKIPPQGGEQSYSEYRQLFISTLYGRRTGEVELWPSQREAARRSTDLSDDLVVALPTSAGKTRVAEIAALMTLSTGKRVLVVTPLRALSAQTERSFRKTFAPLGFSVSSLYGTSGVSAGDEDALRSKSIVIATPEKLDFALRSDPSLIDDVGLIVLDEGHLIGPSEREIRYEILVQRLLRRADASTRRIVCLSAILPEGAPLDDLTAWIRNDAPGGPVKSIWRPTRQRFGSVVWRGKSARLNFDLNEDGAFVARFLDEVAAKKPEKVPYPRKVQDLSLFAAWEFARQGKRTLIFSTQANWVEGFGTTASKLVQRGYLESLVSDATVLNRALTIGAEWLGAQHPAVNCLRVGVAVHHGKLPTPFLRELEILLSEGAIKIIVASPTLSQGLNLNAAVLLVPYLVRSGETIKGEEFANVAGRAGRAFVDVEGLVAHVIRDKAAYRLEEWRTLVTSARARSLRSGLIQVIAAVLNRLRSEGVLDRDDAFEYLCNAREAWAVNEATDGDADDEDEVSADGEPLAHLVERLDATVFGLIEALDADSADLPRLLDDALNGSLWARQIDDDDRAGQRLLLEARASLIWKHSTPSSRRGHFAMGVGLDAGLSLDEMADDLARLLDQADLAALSGQVDELVEAVTELAARLLVIRPFVPNDPLPPGWKKLLSQWISGVDVETIGPDRMKTVEDAFAYRLVWALEAIRTRRMALGWSPDIVAGGAAAAVETGVPGLMAAMLIRAGLPSRRAAIAAIKLGNGEFFDAAGMRSWLTSEDVVQLSAQAGWPTAQSADLWKRFREQVLGLAEPRWRHRLYKRALAQHAQEKTPTPGDYRVEIDAKKGRAWVTTPDFRRLVSIRRALEEPHGALYRASFVAGDDRAHVRRLGPGAPVWADPNE